jgi:hypothetical protein
MWKNIIGEIKNPGQHADLAITHISTHLLIQVGFLIGLSTCMNKSVLPLFFSPDPVQWAEAQWGRAELGDTRRTRRAVKLDAARTTVAQPRR